MQIIDWNPAKGMCFQGDVAIIPVPEGITISRLDEVQPINGRLILQEGEVTGHHHAITLPKPQATAPVKTSLAVETLMADALAGKIDLPTAKLYRDAAAAQAMVNAGVLTRSDLCVAFLIVEGGPMTVSHEEHDGIRIPPGSYYVGRQVESAGAEERRVAD